MDLFGQSSRLPHWVGTRVDRWSIVTWVEQENMFLPFQIVTKHKTDVTQFSLVLLVLT